MTGVMNLPEPMVRRRDRRHGHTETDGCDLSTVQEVGAKEANRHEHVEEVDEHAGGDLGRLVLGAEGRGDRQCYHTAAHTRSRDHEDGTAPEAVNGEEGDEGRQELPSQRAASKGTGVLRGHAQVGLEDDGCVHRDEVGTPESIAVSQMSHCPKRILSSGEDEYLRHLLIELQQHAEAESVEKLVLSHRENVGQLDLVAGLLLERVLNALKLGLNLDGIHRLGPEGRNDTAGLLCPVLHHKPSRRLGEEVDSGGDHGREDDSDGNWWTPSDRAGLELEEAEVDPRLERVSHADEQSVNNDMSPTVLGASRLTLPDRDDGTQLADAETNQDTADDELGEGKGRGLEDDADEGGDTGDEDDIAAAELITRPRAGQGADQGADNEGSDDEALQGGVGALLGALGVDRVDLGEGLGPVLQCDQAAQARLVVPEADEGGRDDEDGLHHGELVAHGAHELDGRAGAGAAVRAVDIGGRDRPGACGLFYVFLVFENHIAL